VRRWSPTAWCADVAGVLATGLPVWCQGVRHRRRWPGYLRRLAAAGRLRGVARVSQRRDRGDRRRRGADPQALLDQVSSPPSVEQERLGGLDHARVEAGAALPGCIRRMPRTAPVRGGDEGGRRLTCRVSPGRGAAATASAAPGDPPCGASFRSGSIGIAALASRSLTKVGSARPAGRR